MSNVHSFHISGLVAFDFHQKPTTKTFLAFANSPASSIKVHYDSAGFRDNDHGGKTHMYRFNFDGAEGMRLTYFGKLVEEINDSEFGYVDELNIFDEQNDVILYNGKGQSKIAHEVRGWIEKNY